MEEIKLVLCTKDYVSRSGIECYEGLSYMIDHSGNVYVKCFICHELSEDFSKFFSKQ